MKKIYLIIILLASGAFFSGCATTKNMATVPKPWLNETESAGFNYALTKAFEEWDHHWDEEKIKKKSKNSEDPDKSKESNSSKISKEREENDKYVFTGKREIILKGGTFYTWKVTHAVDEWIVVDVDGVETVESEKKIGESVVSKMTTIKISSDRLEKRDSLKIQVISKKSDMTFNVFPETVTIKSPETKGKVAAKFQVEDKFSAKKHFGKTFADTFYCLKVIIKNNYDEPVTVESGSISLPIFYVSKLALNSDDDTLENEMSKRFEKWFTVEYDNDQYKVRRAKRTPMNFTAVLGTVRYDQYHNPRSFAVRILRSAGVIAGAVAPFVTADDFGDWAAFFTGPLTGEFEKHLLADLVANLEFMNANALHESITIKENGSVSKYVFFPRGDVDGRWGLNLAVRILSIYTDRDATLTATVLKDQENVLVNP